MSVNCGRCTKKENKMHISNRSRKGFKRIALSDEGKVVGESHPKSELTDAEVDLVRDLREEHGVSYANIVWIFKGRGVTKRAIKAICLYERRNVHAVKSKYIKE